MVVNVGAAAVVVWAGSVPDVPKNLRARGGQRALVLRSLACASMSWLRGRNHSCRVYIGSRRRRHICYGLKKAPTFCRRSLNA